MEDRLSAAINLFKQKKHQIKIRRQELNEVSPLQDENNQPTPLQDEIQALGHDGLEDYEAALEEAEQKVNSIHDDPNAIKQYEDTLAEIETVEAQLDQVQGSKDRIGRKIQQLLETWKATLENSITEINKLFTGYMSELGVTGEVKLKRGGEKGDEDKDFKKWGIEIKVSFREGVKAQVLSAQVQ